MKNNRKGFISMSLIYTFFLLFVSMLVYILGYYTHSIGLLNTLKNDIKNNLQSSYNQTWDQKCYNLSNRLNCKLLFKEGGGTLIGNKDDITDFSTPVTTDDKGLYKTYETNSTTDYPTYFYRGDITNNFVAYGKDLNGLSQYWQVVRINGDGSIRLIYYGTSLSASLPTKIDNLAIFKQSLDIEDDPKIVTSNYCRNYVQIYSYVSQDQIFNCQNNIDDNYTSKIGYIGLNEAIAAGASNMVGLGYYNTGYYLYGGFPYETNNENLTFNNYTIIDANGELQLVNTPSMNYRPVISIAANLEVNNSTDNGSRDNPYRIE